MIHQKPWMLGRCLAIATVASSFVSGCWPVTSQGGAARAQFQTSPDKTFPAKAVINVKTAYGARGDGITDDTAAIQQAITDHIGKGQVLYFPRGTYLVSRTLAARKANGAWMNRLTLQGQNRDETIIKLKDNLPAFNAVGSDGKFQPKAVIYTASNTLGSARGDGGGNNAFHNYILDLTVDVGANAGAVGVDYLANNLGAIRDVKIKAPRGQGLNGIRMTRGWPGPAILKRVTIEGFNYGIYLRGMEYSMTAEQLTLNNQRTAGIYNVNNVLSVRDLTSINQVPVIQNAGRNLGLITVVNGSFRGGSPAVSAIDNQAGLYVRNVSAAGYQSCIKTNKGVVPGGFHAEFQSDPVKLLFPSPKRALQLPVEETPDYFNTNLSHWANVEDFGAKHDPKVDDTAAIQRAIDSGATTIYFPKGRYAITKPIHIRGQVRHLVGLQSTLTVPKGSFNNAASPKGMFRFENRVPVVMEGFKLAAPLRNGPGAGQIGIEHAASSTVTLKDMEITTKNKAYQNTAAGTGRLFLENVVGGPFYFNRQQVWARQLNTESRDLQIRNNGGQLWILGLKTEKPATVVETVNQGKTELMGGLLYQLRRSKPLPAFVNNESAVSLTFAESAYKPAASYQILVKETRAGKTKNLSHDDVLPRHAGTLVPLYVGLLSQFD